MISYLKINKYFKFYFFYNIYNFYFSSDKIIKKLINYSKKRYSYKKKKCQQTSKIN